MSFLIIEFLLIEQQTPKSLNYNIYTIYNKIKALSKHTGSKKKKQKNL